MNPRTEVKKIEDEGMFVSETGRRRRGSLLDILPSLARHLYDFSDSDIVNISERNEAATMNPRKEGKNIEDEGMCASETERLSRGRISFRRGSLLGVLPMRDSLMKSTRHLNDFSDSDSDDHEEIDFKDDDEEERLSNLNTMLSALQDDEQPSRLPRRLSLNYDGSISHFDGSHHSKDQRQPPRSSCERRLSYELHEKDVATNHNLWIFLSILTVVGITFIIVGLFFHGNARWINFSPWRLPS